MDFLNCPVCKKEAIYAEFDFLKNGCKFVCRECGYETRIHYSNKSAADAFDCAKYEVQISYARVCEADFAKSDIEALKNGMEQEDEQ